MLALDVRSLGRRFGRRQAVQDVSFQVRPGEVFGLLGPNGSGKTTTLACALGLLAPSSGEAHVLGEPAAKLHRTQGRVGVVFDGANLLDGLTVHQNLSYAQRLLGHSGGRSIGEALELTDMAGFAKRRAARLSLGEKKRVAVARALLGSPELVVLDEPLSALDPLGVRSMLELIGRLAEQGITLVISSHRLHEMERVISHAGILAAGRLVACGSLEELLGGDSQRYSLEVTPEARARELVGATEGAGLAGGEHGAGLLVDLSGVAVGELNRRLVESGCEVTGIRRERADLAALFDDLVRGADA